MKLHKSSTLRVKPAPQDPFDAMRADVRALFDAAGTESNSTVEICEISSDTPPDSNEPRISGGKDVGPMGLLHEYLKTLGVPESLVPELAADAHALALARVKAEVAGRAAPVAAPQVPAPAARSFTEALEAMTLKERRAALIQHYGLLPDKDGKYRLPEDSQWRKAKEGNPTPERFREWLNVVFADRREIGMVLSDLKHLDEDAYDKVVHGWARKNSKVPKKVIESFGLPTRITKYDPVRDAEAPKSFIEVVERAARGEDTFKNLKRSFDRASPHL